MAAYDPRKPKPNTEIREILKAAGASWQALKSEKDHAVRLGTARILIAHLEELCVQPEFIRDLEDGAIETTAAYLPSEELTHADIHFGEKTPFDDPGSSAGKYFFYADTGDLSRLFSGKPIDPYELPHMHTMGYYVYTLEKVYAAPTPTTCHVRDEEVFRKIAGNRRLPPADQHFALLADPRGLRSGKKSCNIVRLKTEADAVKKADELAAMLNIRIVVARIMHRFCTH